jgi:hypothetical protein
MNTDTRRILRWAAPGCKPPFQDVALLYIVSDMRTEAIPCLKGQKHLVGANVEAESGPLAAEVRIAALLYMRDQGETFVVGRRPAQIEKCACGQGYLLNW